MKSSAVQLQNHSPQTIIYDKLFRPIHDLRVSVIDRCNFRCNYCMPQEHFHEKYTFLNKEEWLQFGEIVRLVKLFTSRGVSKVRITGGEPLLREELFELVHLLAAMTEIDDLALTTNGFFLKKQARRLKAAGLHRLTVSLDTLDEKIFSKINGGKGSVREVLNGIREAEACGFGSVKINTVIQRGVNDSTVLDLIEYFRGSPHIIRFIEYMDVGNKNHWSKDKVVSSKEIIDLIGQKYPLKTVTQNYFGEVAERYEYADGKGEIGFVSSISQPFCSSCTRARLSADGKFFTCLFASEGIDLRTPLRQRASDEELLSIIDATWQKREDRYSERRFSNTAPKKKIEMYQIGG